MIDSLDSTYAGGDIFYHDESPCVSTDSSISEQMLGIPSGIVVVIHRPEEYKVWKYRDENDPLPSNEPSDNAPDLDANGEGKRGDVDMEVDGQGCGEVSENGSADELAGRTRTLRSKGD